MQGDGASFEELLARAYRRFADFRDRLDVALLDDAAVAEAESLWEMAQPVDPAAPTDDRLLKARHAKGLLHYLRWAARRDHPDAGVDLAVAVTSLGPLVDHPEWLPDGFAEALTERADLATTLLAHAWTTTDPRPLDAAITLFTEALAVDVRRALIGTALAGAHYERYRRAGAVADLDLAIELLSDAVRTTPADDPERAERLCDLGTAHRTRHEHGGLFADLVAAQEFGEAAVAARPDHARYLSQLGLTYAERHRRTSRPSDLDRSVALAERAVATGDGDAGHLANLASAHHDRYQVTGETADLDLAVALRTQALAATPEHDPGRPLALAGLAADHYRRYGHTHDPADLDRAVALTEQAVAALPAGDRDQARFLANLGTLYHARQGVSAETLRDFVFRVRTAGGGPLDRAWAHLWAGVLAHAMDEHATAAALLDTAVGLLPSVVPDGAGWADREHRVGQQAGVIGEAVAAHCAMGDAAGAVDVAELGRGLFADAAPVRFADARSAIPHGAVVLVNAGRRRSDAVVLTSAGDPVIVPLPELKGADVPERITELLQVTYAARLVMSTPTGRRVLPALLEWLWDTTVAPILAAVPTDRIWWLPVGLLGLLPLHAAGPSDGPGALDRVVSSYLPTLGTLVRDRRSPGRRRQLIVSMAHTPGLADLRGTVAEAEHLRAAHPDAVALADDLCTRERVLATLPDATWAHFACHAGADIAAPSRGGLFLHDGVLTLPTVAALRLPNAELAYLSACSTALHGIRQADQSLHLAAACHLAGFRHVVASLWPLHDAVAATAARAFYDRLPGTSADNAARVLRDVVLELRADRPDRPHLWAPLVHSGP